MINSFVPIKNPALKQGFYIIMKINKKAVPVRLKIDGQLNPNDLKAVIAFFAGFGLMSWAIARQM